MSAPTVSIVIPVYNEAATLPKLVSELVRAVPSSVVLSEIIIVDDASTDGFEDRTVRIDPAVRVVHLRERGGSGHARRIGSTEAHGEWVAWIDGDGTYAAADLWRLVGAAEGADQVIGVRAVDFGSLALLRRLAKGAAFRTASLLWGVAIPDLNSGLRVFRRSCLLEIVPELPAGFSCTSTSTLAALNRRHRVRFVPIGYHPRATGHASKFHPVWDTLRLWRVIVRQWVRRRTVPTDSGRDFATSGPCVRDCVTSTPPKQADHLAANGRE